VAVPLAVAVLALAVSTDAVGASSSGPPACSANTTVQTAEGAVCGLTASGITTYFSVPYAAAPVGNLRWAPPQPHAPWSGVLASTQEAVECDNVFTTTNSSEDCLNLKIEVPAGTSAGADLPVMFEFHGGGFIGEARTDDGDNLVNAGKVIYVYVNYRLGILGFLADKAFGPHAGDYGLEDQQAGLKWVQQNISQFGGNPNNVTVFGESAGGASTCAEVASPTAKGLFEKAISVSGFYNYQNNIVWSKADCKSHWFTEAQAQKASAAFAAKVGCGPSVPNVAACLRAIPAATLLAEGGQVGDPTGGGTGGIIGPVINGTTETMSPVDAIDSGHANHVTLITDVGANEFNGGVYTNSFGSHIVVAETPAQYDQLVQEQFGNLAPKVEQLYPLSHFESPFTAYRQIMADSASVCPMLQMDGKASRHMTVYADVNNDNDNPAGEDLTAVLGAQHSGSNGLVHFDTADLDANQAALQLQLLKEWTGLANNGTPSAANTPAWQPFASHGHPVMLLQPGDSSLAVPSGFLEQEHNCAFWDRVTHY
jgi:para-nitrobenzyl esterase